MAKCPKCGKNVSFVNSLGKDSYICQHCGITPLVMTNNNFLLGNLLFLPFIISIALAKYHNAGWAVLSWLMVLFYYSWWRYIVKLKVAEQPSNSLIFTKVPGWIVFITVVLGLVFLFFIALYYKYTS